MKIRSKVNIITPFLEKTTFLLYPLKRIPRGFSAGKMRSLCPFPNQPKRRKRSWTPPKKYTRCTTLKT